MPKDASLKPKKIQSRADKKQSAWMLSIPPDLSDNGRRQQKFYATQKEGDTAAEQIKRRRDNFGNSLASLSPERLAQAGEAFRIIDEKLPALNLLQIVKERVQIESKRAKSLEFGELFDRYIKAHHMKTPAHLAKLRYCKVRFKDLHEKLVCDLTHEDFEKVLDKLKPAMRNAEMRYLRSVLNFAYKRKLLDDNPVDRLDFADIHKKPVEIFPLDVVERLLVDAAQHDLELLGFLALGLFAGIRPHGELQKLKWRDVSLEDKHVILPEDITKDRQMREIELSDNAVAWLRLTGEHQPTEKIVTSTFDVFRKKREASWSRVSQGHKWIHQGMRHSFCSYHMNAYNDQNKTQRMTGHATPDMLRKKYFRAGLKAEALKFWKIMPPA